MLLRLLTRPLIPALLFFALLAAAGFVAVDRLLMPWAAGKFKHTAEVPALVGLAPEKAEEAMRAAGLILMRDSATDYSPDVPAGLIQTQFPGSGTEVKRGRRVWVKISKGLRGVELPPLRGMSLRQAEISLQQLGLKLGRVRPVRGSPVPPGAVIGSRPKAGALLEKGRVVDLDISSDGSEQKAEPEKLATPKGKKGRTKSAPRKGGRR
jgi:serine/threonine-protein kinase